MNTSEQIIQYLEELATALAELHVSSPFHILIAGGAYMLLNNKRKFTEDIDFAIIERPRRARPKKAFHTTIQRTEIASRTSAVPFATEFKQAVGMVAQRHNLLDDWLNDEAAVYFYDDAPHAEVTFWRAFGNTVYAYLPTAAYVLATKIAAFRPKDADDIQQLLRDLGIHTRAQAKAIVDQFLLPDAQEFWEVEEKLDTLFP